MVQTASYGPYVPDRGLEADIAKAVNWLLCRSHAWRCAHYKLGRQAGQRLAQTVHD